MDTATAPATAAGPTAAHSLIDARLSRIEDVARDTKLYTFERVDGGKLPGYKPGAHIDLHLPNGLLRQFSLTVPGKIPTAIPSASSATKTAAAARAISSMR